MCDKERLTQHPQSEKEPEIDSVRYLTTVGRDLLTLYTATINVCAIIIYMRSYTQLGFCSGRGEYFTSPLIQLKNF